MIILNSAITTPITNHNLQLEALMSENSTKDQIQIQTCSVKQPLYESRKGRNTTNLHSSLHVVKYEA